MKSNKSNQNEKSNQINEAKELFELKKDYKRDNIFIYKCSGLNGCKGYIMIHQEECPQCQAPNQYYDQRVQVSKSIVAEVSEKLAQL